MKKQYVLGFIIWALVELLIAQNSYIGVYLENISSKHLTEKGLDNGVRVNLVIPFSPAEQADMKVNDIIISIEQRNVTKKTDVKQILDDFSPGDTISLVVKQKNGISNKELRLGNIEELKLTNYFKNLFEQKKKYIGIKLINLNEQLLDFFAVDNGVLISEIVPNTPCSALGLKAGDIIVKMDGKVVDNAEEIRKIIENHSLNIPLKIEVVRKKRKMSYRVPILEKDMYDEMNDEINNFIEFAKKNLDVEKLNDNIKESFSDSTKTKFKKSLEKIEKELLQLKQKIEKDRS